MLPLFILTVFSATIQDISSFNYNQFCGLLQKSPLLKNEKTFLFDILDVYNIFPLVNTHCIHLTKVKYLETDTGESLEVKSQDYLAGIKEIYIDNRIVNFINGLHRNENKYLEEIPDHQDLLLRFINLLHLEIFKEELKNLCTILLDCLKIENKIKSKAILKDADEKTLLIEKLFKKYHTFLVEQIKLVVDLNDECCEFQHLLNNILNIILKNGITDDVINLIKIIT